tara:strand:- start:620 stop:2749 length:2130 start_codon:yes stop_codon:yes gene_type:complete
MNTQQLIAYPQGTTLPITFPSGEVVLDLFKNEPIPLVLNVDDFTNVAEADASYSKSFDIPGTKNNNTFFNNIFNVTASSDFDTHKKTRIIVKENTLNTFEGYMQLNDISNKDGVITYNITIYSEVVNLKESIGNKVFRDLDLSEINHLYSSGNIENSWAGNLLLYTGLPANSFAGSTGATTTDVLKYPMVNWAGHTTSSNGNWGFYLLDYFRPWVNALYLLQNIFKDAGYTFTSTFLNSNTFKDLYVDFNIDGSDTTTDPAAHADGITGTYNTTGAAADATTVVGGQAALYDLTTNKITVVSNGTRVQLESYLYMLNTSNYVEISIHHDNTSYTQNPTSPHIIWSGSTSSSSASPIDGAWGDWILDTGDSIWLEIRSQTTGTVSIDTSGLSSYVSWHISYNADQDLDRLLLGFRGDNSQWDFFKSFIDMFKLVVLVDENNPDNLLIEPYKDWVAGGDLLDWTNKIDDSEIVYTPIDGLSRQIDFLFTEDSDDWITPNLNNPSINTYGYKYRSDIEIIDKDIDIVEISGFSDTYVANLAYSGSPAVIMPQIIDKSISPGGSPAKYWENNMRILYDNGIVTLQGGTTFSTYGADATQGFDNKSDYLLFSAVKDFPVTNTSTNIRFNTISESYTNKVLLNNLYNTYWVQYIDELYNKDTRIIKVEAYLTPEDITKLNFNDIILIKSTRYRIYKIEYRSGAMSKIELLTVRNL